MNITESLNVEFKRDFIEEINNEIIAFLNTNGGTIYRKDIINVKKARIFVLLFTIVFFYNFFNIS